jgi:hypothetical protein
MWGGGGGYKGLRCHNSAQRWMKLDDFNHELPHTSDAGVHVLVEVVAYSFLLRTSSQIAGEISLLNGQLLHA